MTTRKKNIKQSNKSSNNKQREMLVKVIIIGDSGVGKTNVLTRYCEGIFKDSYVATIGVDFKIKVLNIDGTKIKLQIWDTAGQERFRNITTTYFKGAAGIILVYSIDNYDSFRNIHNWMKQIESNSSEESTRILIGTKADLTADRQVQYEQGQKLAQKHQMLFMQVSAKNGQNVNECFTKLTQQIKTKKISQNPSLQFPARMNLDSQKVINKKKCEC